MKVGELEFDVQYVGAIKMRDVECTPDEFKDLLEVVKELQKMEVEKEKMRVEAFKMPPKPTEVE